MKLRAYSIDFRGIIEHRHEADDFLDKTGTAVLVHRGVNRSIAMACPDGCGEVLTINLDRRTGPAWRVYIDSGSLSLYPSVWRHSGCKSHFIVWRSRIYWCDASEELLPMSSEFEQLVLSNITIQPQSYIDIAEALDTVPWAVLSACHRLSARGIIQSGSGKQRSSFWLIGS